MSPFMLAIHYRPLPTHFPGFVNGDTQTAATAGAASLSTTATTAPKVGRCYITGTQGSLQAHNYTFLSNVADYGILTVIL